jgi:hypothetical protein
VVSLAIFSIRLSFAQEPFRRKGAFRAPRERFSNQTVGGISRARASLRVGSVAVNVMRLWTFSEKWKSAKKKKGAQQAAPLRAENI